MGFQMVTKAKAYEILIQQNLEFMGGILADVSYGTTTAEAGIEKIRKTHGMITIHFNLMKNGLVIKKKK